MRVCVQCHREVKHIKTEFINDPDKETEVIEMGVCEHADCPNYHLTQIPEEVEEENG